MKTARSQTQNLIFISFFLFVFILLNTVSAFTAPSVTTYQAKIIKPDGLPLEANPVNFKFTILDSIGTCILYAETFSAVNMSSTGGVISFALGSGIKTYPVSATTFEQVFSNITPSLSCDAGGPGSISPAANDVRKIIMQFHDGSGWQTLPAMSINAVPYAMYATNAEQLGGVSATAFVQDSEIPTCAGGTALFYNGTSFSCVAVGGGGAVSASTIATALGYTPADGASVTALISSLGTANSNISSVSGSVSILASNLSLVSSTVFSVSSTVNSLSNSVSTFASTVAASFAAITSSPWSTSGTAINYLDRVGIGTVNPTSLLTVSGSASVSGDFILGNTPPIAGTFDFGPLIGSGVTYKSPFFLQDTITDFSNTLTGGHVSSIKFNTSGTTSSIAAGSLRYTQVVASSGANFSGGVVGDYPILENDGSGPVSVLTGISPLVMQNGPGSVTSMYGVHSRVYNYQGNVNSSFGAVFSSANFGGTIQNNYGVMIDVAGASVTNNYGLFVADQSIMAASQTYNIYSSGFNSKNAFMGSVGVGLDKPSAKLHLSAATSLYPSLKLTSGTLLTSPQSGSIEYDGFNLYYTDGTNTRRTVANTSSGVTSASIVTALGYTPANSATVSALSTQVTSLAALVSGATSSQWTTSGTAITFDGSVGIGTPSPNYPLQVSGTVKASTILVNDGSPTELGIAFAGSPASGFYRHSSAIVQVISGTGVTTTGSTGLTINVGYMLTPYGTAANPAWGFNADAGVGVFRPATDTFGIATSSLERFRITASGAIGIGTAAPNAPLEVSGTAQATEFLAGDGAFNNPSISFANGSTTGFYNNGGNLGVSIGGGLRGAWSSNSLGFNAGGAGPQINFTGGNASTPSYAFNVDSDTGMFNPNSSGGSNELGFSTSGAERVRITSGGLVGIGISTPTATLHVSGALAYNNILMTSENYSAISAQGGSISGWPLFQLHNQAANGKSYNIEVGRLSPGTFGINDNASNTTRIAISPVGNVGIGHTGPTANLTVGSTNNINTGSNLQNGVAPFRITDGTSISILIDSNQIEQMDPTNSLYLNYNSSASTILNYGGGFVGVGTLTPGAKFSVEETVTMQSNGQGATFRLTNSTSVNSDYFQVGGISEDNWAIMSADSATHRNTILAPWGGNVGISNTNPTYKLDVTGDIRITGTPYRAGGDIAWTVPSDARLKDVVSTYNRGLREIANIDTIIYKYKKDNPKQADSTKEYTGVLAQQVQEQIPEAVTTDKDGFLSLNTTPIFWAMINAIKEVYQEVIGIKAENAQLKAQAFEQARKIQSLEEENAAVKARLERIEKALENQNK